MKTLKTIIALLCAVCFCACSSTDDPTVRALAKRLLPEQESSFKFQVVETDSETDFFELESKAGKITISGNNSNSIAVGLNYYLKNYCLTTISWYKSNPIQMPAVLPSVEEKIHINARAKERFFLNYCTFGYTMPWWGWDEWEHFIDWMAINGVTMPLAITGQEAVWQKVWTKLGLTNEEVVNYFTGPAHLPWHRMTNIDYWQGPLPQGWIDGQLELQKLIVARERELGMRPVLPAFAGHVPQEIKRLYPDAQITQVSKWGGFDDKYRCSFLAPMDPLFAEIQKEFMTIQTELFGTDNIYGADPFNEIDSPSWDPETLAAMSKCIYDSMTQVDPEAIWLQMGWLFYADPTHWTGENIDAFVNAVPKGKMILLDYYCEYIEIWKDTESFYGQPYIWCYLGNFGGNTMISGNFKTCSERLEDAFANGGDNLQGIGSTLEGFGVNQWFYEFILDKAWDSGMTDEEWVNNLADRHLGFRDQTARDTWQSICNELYVLRSQTGHSTLVGAHPSLEGNWFWTTKPITGYEFPTLWNAWQKMLTLDSDRDLFEYDLVNLGRQALGDYFLLERNEFTQAFYAKDLEGMKHHGDRMLMIIDDMDLITSCHKEFSLKDWIDAARQLGESDEEKDYYETNARTLISVWGDNIELTDYASRSWSGLISTYYKSRWQLFIDEVTKAAKSGKKFDQKAFDKLIRIQEFEWASSDHKISFREMGDPVKIANEIAVKYKADFDKVK